MIKLQSGYNLKPIYLTLNPLPRNSIKLYNSISMILYREMVGANVKHNRAAVKMAP
jgi:hypothetical protein